MLILRKEKCRACQFLLLFLLTSLIVRAEDKKPAERRIEYDSETSLSLVLVKGNNNNLSYSLDTEQNLDILKNRVSLRGRFISSRSNGAKTAEIYYGHLKYDRRIGSWAYLLGFTRYERNQLAGYNYRLALSFGAGATWIKRPRTTFLSELALGWNNENTTKRLKLDNVGSNPVPWTKTLGASFPASILNSRLTYRITSSSETVFRETLFINLDNANDYRLNTYVSLSASISPQLALKTSIELIYEHLPVPGFKTSDTYLLSSVVIRI
jgi:putative salt-induced outer membrane protein YdiY